MTAQTAINSGNEPNRRDADWHALAAAEALAWLKVDRHGLTAAEAERRRARFGPNALPGPARRGAFGRLLRQFNNLLIYVLIAAGLITALLGHWTDTIVGSVRGTWLAAVQGAG